jgi:hypothetical protein
MHVPHATNFYGKFENLKFDFFYKKRLFQIKMALTFAYGLEKKRIIYEKLSTQNFTSDFNSLRPFAQEEGGRARPRSARGERGPGGQPAQ